jgi:acyl carrier protein
MTQQEFSLACKVAIAKAKSVDVEKITIADNETFAMYGLDSLDVMNFLLELEMESGISLDDVDMKEYNSIDKLFAFVIK